MHCDSTHEKGPDHRARHPRYAVAGVGLACEAVGVERGFHAVRVVLRVLAVADCELLVLDATFKDAKNFTLLSLKTVSDDLAAIVRKALQKNPDDRYQSASARPVCPHWPF